MRITNDQYYATGELRKWYRNGRKQIFELSGTIGSGIMHVVDDFLQSEDLEPYEVCYLTYDQETVMQYALKRLHCYYLPEIIYKHYKWTNLDSFDFFNPFKKTETKWVQDTRGKIKGNYRLFVVLDSLLIDRESLENLVGFGKPILLLRDPCLTPARDSYCYGKDPTAVLTELNPTMMEDPIVYFAMQVLAGNRIKIGSYDTVNVINKRSLNISNLRNADMVLTLTDDLADEINSLYRNRIKNYGPVLKAGERVMCMSDMYGYKMSYPEEPRLKCYLRSGLVGKISKCNFHAFNTRYVTGDFKLPWWPDPFRGLTIDRSLMLPANIKLRNQVEPDDPVLFKFAYALPVMSARIGSWDKCTIICDCDEMKSRDTRSLIYTAITRCNKRLTLCI